MSRRLFLLLLVMVLAEFSLDAEGVRVTGVAGEVMFTPAAGANRVVKAGDHLGPGTFAAAGNGILYLSNFYGSELRLSESGTLHYEGTDGIRTTPSPSGPRSSFQLLAGKLEVTIKFALHPQPSYRIGVPHGRATVASGQCVFCLHGNGTFVYVARGETAISGESQPAPPPPMVNESAPVYGALPTPGTAGAGSPIMVRSGQVGVIGIEGVRAQPLSSLTAGTQACLRAGFKGEAGAGAAKKNGFSADASAIVSPTQ